MEYGLQLFSVRDAAAHGLLEAVGQVARMGYRMVEFAGFFGAGAQEVRAALERCGARVSGTHTPIDALLQDFAGTVAYHRALGNRDIIIPGADLSTGAKLDAFIDDVNRLLPLLEAEGIALCYHNHDHEFRPNGDGRIIFDELVAKTRIGLEIDAYWAYAAGRDPVKLMEEHRGRLRFVHLKDGLADGTGKPLGMGTAPVLAVRAKALELGVPMIVESETLTPDGMTEAQICIDYLRGLE